MGVLFGSQILTVLTQNLLNMKSMLALVFQIPAKHFAGRPQLAGPI